MKLQSIHIQNFTSLKNVHVRLDDVNLLIGPNNSGKSNLLKALLFLNEMADTPYQLSSQNVNEKLRKYSFNKLSLQKHPIVFELTFEKENGEQHIWNNINLSIRESTPSFFKNIAFYSLNPAAFTAPTPLTIAHQLNSDGSNLVSFLDNLQQKHRKNFQKIEQELNRCISDFEFIGTPTVAFDNHIAKKQIQLTDIRGTNYTASELSEGTLYFLGLLALVFQPNPPQLLLIEEPEKGIHPRRLKELIDYIFLLADDHDIQVIMTTHSPYLVDEFKDIPEAVHVFDMVDGATQIKNLQYDIMDKYPVEMKLNGSSLGDHWFSGIFRGVPPQIIWTMQD